MLPSFLTDNLAHARVNPSIKDFEGFELSYYDQSSGSRYLKLDCQKALTEKPKVGFLTFGLSFLKVEDLSIYLDARFTDPDLVSDLNNKLSRSKGIGYAVAEPISLAIHTKEVRMPICAKKAKFTADHSLNIWGEVVLEENNNSRSLDKLSISINPMTIHLSIECPNEIRSITIPHLLNSPKNS